MLPALRIAPAHEEAAPAPEREMAAPEEGAPAPRRCVAELYERYGPLVYRRSLRLLGDKEAARDATQEVFLKLIRDVAQLEDRVTVLPWMYRVTTNYCLNLRRNARRRGEEELPELEPSAEYAVESFPDRLLAQAILSRFDVATQAVVVGVIVDGLGHEEMAAALGVSRKTIARKLDRFLVAAREFASRAEAR